MLADGMTGGRDDGVTYASEQRREDSPLADRDRSRNREPCSSTQQAGKQPEAAELEPMPTEEALEEL